MSTQEEIDLKNRLIDEIRLHPEIYDKSHVEHSNRDRRINIFDGIATLLGISSEYSVCMFYGTM